MRKPNPLKGAHVNVLHRRLGAFAAAAAVVVLAAACSSPTASDAGDTAASAAASVAGEASEAAASEMASEPAASEEAATGTPMEQTLAFIASGEKPEAGKKIAYLTECVNNPYCGARLRGVEDAAKEYGMELQVFDANFNPQTQLTQVQDAIQQGFDGYIFMPVADGPGCSAYKLLEETGAPVATGNSPMCGNADYTEGTLGMAAMQTEKFFQDHVENAFASCEGECEAMAVGGYVGSDLFTRWENAIQAAAAKYPNVKVVVDQPGDFDPKKALQVTQDALKANPNISIVVSSWDDMTRGVEEGVTAAGKVPGQDVKIFSVGGTKDAISRIEKGDWTGTSILLPYEESYYPVVHLARFFATGEATPGFTNLAEAPTVVDGPGSVYLTADNAGSFTAEY
jgi:ABC-type sugar transport system substrate-binding protein